VVYFLESRTTEGIPVTDESTIRDIMRRRVDAMRTKDVASFLGDYASQTITFELAPPLRHTAPKVESHDTMTAWLESKGDIDYEIQDLVVTAGTDIAFCHCLIHLLERDADGAVANNTWYRTTLGLRKVNGKWQIEHEHNSTPFYMDDEARAATDLKP
jgi:ketosteroid isomerase-like protein